VSPLGWFGIVRLGLVQSAIGAIVMLATSLLNRVMVVEYALPAALPAGLVAWHYAVQLSRPAWGHRSDRGRRRTPWIVFGMATLALGATLATQSIGLLAERSTWGYALALVAFTLIGIGVGAAGTSLLALLATRVAPERRAAAAAITWIMMIAGIVVTAGVAGTLVDPFSLSRLAIVSGGVAAAALLVSVVAIWGVEGARSTAPAPAPVRDAAPAPGLRDALRETWADGTARRFTAFVFLSMLAYSMQDLILEPFAGLLFALTPGQSTQLSGLQHAGVLAGMIVVGVGGNAFGARGQARGEGGLGRWIVGGCLGSAVALCGLALAARVGPGWPLSANIALLGFANGVFAVAAIGRMMALAGADKGREGTRMGVWGAAQAIAFGLGGLVGAVGVDAGRALTGSKTETFTLVFGAEALLFLAAASLASRGVAKPAGAWPVGGKPA
jgi:BCD family chlorophyll transporter-like MFS transporter